MLLDINVFVDFDCPDGIISPTGYTKATMSYLSMTDPAQLNKGQMEILQMNGASQE